MWAGDGGSDRPAPILEIDRLLPETLPLERASSLIASAFAATQRRRPAASITCRYQVPRFK